MKKVLIISVVMLLMLGSVAMASETRVLTMGENNLILLDDANIWLFPSRVFEYPNLAVGEFSNVAGNEFTNFGVHWKFGSDNPWVLGTYFSDISTPALPTDLMGGSVANFTELGDLDNRRLDLFYGNQLGAYNFGTRITFYNSSYESDDAADQTKESFSFYNLNLGLTSESGNWDLALDVAFGTWTDEDAAGLTETEPDGMFDFAVLGRYLWQRGPDYTFIPHASFVYSKVGVKDYIFDGDATTLDFTDKYTVTAFDFGFGMNYTPARNVLAVCDFGFAYGKWKAETEDPAGASAEMNETLTVLPYFKIGLDADVFKWMDIRLGATSYWNNESFKDEVANSEEKFKYAENETYLGFGFNWGHLFIDTYTDPELFLQGFDFISGNGDVDMNFRISVIYEMM